MSKIIESNPEILGGTPIFIGTRVPVKNLFDYLEAGNSIDDFISDFPSVEKDKARELIQEISIEVVKNTKIA